MIKAIKKNSPKRWTLQYDPPVCIAGTFRQMIIISATGSGATKEGIFPFTNKVKK
ncbi:MAG TPA: hypothetical protein PLZ68_17880 [Ferruginibacter sp.]|nr:hypothetical protein [Ferruginibacter sp.]